MSSCCAAAPAKAVTRATNSCARSSEEAVLEVGRQLYLARRAVGDSDLNGPLWLYLPIS